MSQVSGAELANVLRLSGLKNTSGRRVMPGEEDLEQLDENGNPLETSTLITNPTENVPQPEMGSGLASQSFDVRANTNVFSKLGNGLHSQMQMYNQPETAKPLTPPIETQQTDLSEGLPPVSASQEEAIPVAPLERSTLSRLGSGLWGAGKALIDPTGVFFKHDKNTLKDLGAGAVGVGKTLLGRPGALSEPLSPVPDSNGNLPLTNQQNSLNAQTKESQPPQQPFAQSQEPKIEPQNAERQAEIQAGIDEQMKNPLTAPVYGSEDIFFNSPELMDEFKTVSGIDMNSPEIQAEVKAVQDILSGQDAILNKSEAINDEQIAGLQERIENNNANEHDKYLIGLALLIPLIVGGFFGKEAGLGALAGGTKGLSEAFANRHKQGIELNEQLGTLNKQKSDLGLKRSEIGLESAKVPSSVASHHKTGKEHLEGMHEVTWKDPETGKEKNGFEIKPGLIALPQYTTTQKDKENMMKQADEINDVRVFAEDVNNLTNDITYLLSQSKDKNLAKKAWDAAISHKASGYLSNNSPEVEFEGRKVNLGTLLQSKFGMLYNQYARAEKLGQLDRTALTHMETVAANPASSFITPQASIDQILEINKLVKTGLLANARNRGFAPEFLIKEFKKKTNETYNRLNKKEEIKESDKLLGKS